MKVVDANVLLYAVNEEAEHHEVAKAWLDAALSGPESVALPWICLLAFIRLSTHASLFEHPLRVDDALDIVDAWLRAPQVLTADADRRHSGRLRHLLAATGAGGNLTNDAHLAALALQYDATVATFDHDFGRFPGVRWIRPSASTDDRHRPSQPPS